MQPVDSDSSSFLSVLVPVYNEQHLVSASLRRLLSINSPLISSLQVMVVYDCSTDGTWKVLCQPAEEDARLVLIRLERNQGKGAAIRSALKHASGEICIVHDADLEYHPDDIRPC